MRRVRTTMAGLILVVGFLGAACAQRGALAPGEAEATTTSTTTTTTTTSTTTVAPGAVPQTPEGGVVRQVHELTGFTSPTGNIGCYIDKERVGCDVAAHTWEPPQKPPDCDLDYEGLGVGATGPASFVCAGDTSLDPSNPPLPYGQSIQAGSLRCTSEEAGMTCMSTETGHGFTVSRAAYRLF